MEKVLINLFVPSVGEKYDVYIPLFLTVAEISNLLAQMLGEIQNQRYVSSGREVLCSLDQKVILEREKTLRDYHVQNGEHLLIC
jgi:hypothetical protein